MQVNINALTKSIIYFQQSLNNPVPPTFEKYVQNVRYGLNYQPLHQKILQILVMRYHQIVHKHIVIQQFLLLQFLKTLSDFAIAVFTKQEKIPKKNNQEITVILLWASISHLKENPHKTLSNKILKFVKILIDYTIKQNIVPLRVLYPQIYSHLMNKVILALSQSHVGEHSQIGYEFFDGALDILTHLLANNKSLSENVDYSVLELKELKKIEIEGSQDCKKSDNFGKQSIERLIENMQDIIKHLDGLQFSYLQRLKRFTIQVGKIRIQNINILGKLSVLMTCLGLDYRNYFDCSDLKNEHIIQLITDRFLKMLQNCHKRFERKTNLTIMKQLATKIHLNDEETLQKVVKKISNQLYTIRISNKLTVLSLSSEPLGLLDLRPNHSFKDHQLSAILDAYQREQSFILASCLWFADGDVIMINPLKNLLCFMNIQSTQNILNCIYDEMILNEYTVEMSLKKFHEYLTQILIIKWCLQNKSLKISGDICNKIFVLISSSQYLRILQPNYKQQEILISLSLYICFYCYLRLACQVKLPKMEFLKYKIIMYSSIFNNISENSYVIRLATHYILLTLSAPHSIQQSIQNIQSTIIHRNLTNITLVTNVIRFGKLSKNDYTELAQIYYQRDCQNHHRGNAQIIRLILEHIQPQLIRKCLLSSRFWPILLKGNTKILNDKQIGLGQKGDNFFGNDGQNVSIKNVLGVLVIQIGYRWKVQLGSPRKELTIDVLLELVQLNPSLVFFRSFFQQNILPQLINILDSVQKSQNNTLKRIQQKIMHILSLIPQQNYQMYTTTILNSLTKAIFHPRMNLQKLMMMNNGDLHSETKDKYKIIQTISQKIEKSVEYKCENEDGI